ncbi:prion-inhibition and propagation-domain-containing protein [Lasiosphaeria hispida]|uniref:Prion-inhibition and propagation-domain-containing protein n=1 Tax=Lasiosphaeria hispida TaxID=260671 RepID=A0AAJ0MEW8_9PEZI|nr:prion-inhibition and propagation-domain-containing protein [Lasiosphaeria hispida]
MTEVAGGAVGIAGVIGAFKDVVDLALLIGDSRHLGRDFEILNTNFDIEKALLLQWSDRVGLLRSDHDKRLDHPETQEIVVRTLTCVKDLLNDTLELMETHAVTSRSNTALAVSSRDRISSLTNTEPASVTAAWKGS